MRGLTLPNKFVALSIVEIIIGEDQIEMVSGYCKARAHETGDNSYFVYLQELFRDLLSKDRVIFQVENFHPTNHLVRRLKIDRILALRRTKRFRQPR